MDLLIVVGPSEVPPHLKDRAVLVIATDIAGMSPEVVAHNRAHSPRTVGVVGSSETAVALKNAGYKVTFYSDDETVDGIDCESITDTGEPMVVADDLMELVGNTPLLRLGRIGRDVKPQIIAKLEYMNPGGSVKDRIALGMVEAAEREGKLKPGGTIVEPTSGNTGVGLAIVAARKGYKCVFVVPDKVAQDKIALLRAYGAEVVVCPTTVAPEHPESYYSVSDRLVSEIPGAYKPDQYNNPNNPLAHELSTGPEIWAQTKGRITHFVAGIGTAGTIVGTARYLKAQNPDVKVIGADPEGSVYSGGSGRPYLVEGVGEDFWPGNYDPSVIDEVIAVSDRESLSLARRLTKEEGVFVGGSAGLAVAAGLKAAEKLSHTDVMVILIPDSGRGYLSKLYNDSWMADYGFLKAEGPTTGDIIRSKGNDIPELVHVHPHETVREVASIMREYAVSQVIVVNAEPPLVMGEVAGSVNEEDLLRLAFSDAHSLDRPIGELMGAVPPTIGMGEAVIDAIDKLEKADALLVVDAGHPVGVLTRSDLLEYLASSAAGY